MKTAPDWCEECGNVPTPPNYLVKSRDSDGDENSRCLRCQDFDDVFDEADNQERERLVGIGYGQWQNEWHP